MTDGSGHLRAVGDGEGATGTAGQESTGISSPVLGNGAGRFLTDVIVELGLLRQEQVDKAVEEAKSTGIRPEHVMLSTGLLTGDQLARAIAERFVLDHIDLTRYRPDAACVNMISASAARRYEAVPVGFDENKILMVAMADPSNVLALDDLRLMTGEELRPVVASKEDIAGVISRMSRLDDAVAAAVEEESEIEEITNIRESAEDAPVIKLVNSIIADAVEQSASDIHFEPDGNEMRVRFRVDGILSDRTTIPKRMVAGVVSRVKIMADLDIAERRMPQDGRVALTVEKHSIDLRIVTLPTNRGEGVTMRILDKEQVLMTLDKLGMREESLTRFDAAFRKPYGAVLVTGPTGSGKSTTLYGALNALNSPDKKIITIEDPVEYQMAGITQIGVNTKSNLTFANGLRSVLRADPDIIMVGEIRDSETARIAIESALTGHLVLSTLHTKDAPSAIARLTEMGIEPFLTASAVDCVVAQRLVRKLCTYCKKRIVVSVDSLRGSGFRADFDIEAYEPGGCQRCNLTGYRGRQGLYEVMDVSDEIRALTVERASGDRIRAVALEQGMRTMREDGLEKVRMGITSVAEVARVT
ncbi:MAG: type pilus assembly protein PilB [Thermoleophilaceae bacterium]|jgi:type IV pilus assembly protein PilB|nr:type pilus assembly protein PilB [Thermoleophilaceae bacterium]